MLRTGSRGTRGTSYIGTCTHTAVLLYGRSPAGKIRLGLIVVRMPASAWPVWGKIIKQCSASDDVPQPECCMLVVSIEWKG